VKGTLDIERPSQGGTLVRLRMPLHDGESKSSALRTDFVERGL
jgi:hypothetical protein